ncbi:uncharacterized protein LOC144337602 [Macaca mulatta]
MRSSGRAGALPGDDAKLEPGIQASIVGPGQHRPSPAARAWGQLRASGPACVSAEETSDPGGLEAGVSMGPCAPAPSSPSPLDVWEAGPASSPTPGASHEGHWPRGASPLLCCPQSFPSIGGDSGDDPGPGQTTDPSSWGSRGPPVPQGPPTCPGAGKGCVQLCPGGKGPRHRCPCQLRGSAESRSQWRVGRGLLRGRLRGGRKRFWEQRWPQALFSKVRRQREAGAAAVFRAEGGRAVPVGRASRWSRGPPLPGEPRSPRPEWEGAAGGDAPRRTRPLLRTRRRPALRAPGPPPRPPPETPGGAPAPTRESPPPSPGSATRAGGPPGPEVRAPGEARGPAREEPETPETPPRARPAARGIPRPPLCVSPAAPALTFPRRGPREAAHEEFPR